MMKSIVFMMLAYALTMQLSAQKWELAKESNGIKVYLADAENTKIKQFKVLAFIGASPDAIAAAVSDLDNNYKWFDNVEKAELVKRISANSFVYKQVVKVPFPFDNRQVVQQCDIKKLSGGMMRIDLVEKNDAIPPDSKYVRMPMVRGYWILTPVKGGTNIEYSFVADPGGAIPPWLANQFIVDGPFKTVSALRNYLVK